MVDQFSNPLTKAMASADKFANSATKINNVVGDTSKSSEKIQKLYKPFEDLEKNAKKSIPPIVDVDKNLKGVSGRNVDKPNASFKALGQTIITVNQGVELLQRGFGALNSFMAGADKRMNVDARLSLIKDEMMTQEQLERQVMGVANLTRTAYEDTANLVATMGRQDYFDNNNTKAVNFAETLNKGLKISGADASETNSVIRQLSQGLASGVLRGDEFNSMMENGSVITEMMAQSLGVTKGELREMAEGGLLTTDIVVGSIMAQSQAIDEQFSKLPVSFGDSIVIIKNNWSQLLNTLQQPNGALAELMARVEQLTIWFNTDSGQAFFGGVAVGVGTVVDGVVVLGNVFAEVYTFFAENWTLLEPVVIGLAAAIGLLALAQAAYNAKLWVTNGLVIASNGITMVSTGLKNALAIATLIHSGATLGEATATVGATVAQVGFNAALMSCPITWVVGAIMVLIGVIFLVGRHLYKLYQTNVEFRASVLGVWNGVLNFFDKVPLFFMSVGNGIADAFSYTKVGALAILDELVNGTIDRINGLIERVNKIPGVAIPVISSVDMVSSTAIKEKAKIDARQAVFNSAYNAVENKALQREKELQDNMANFIAGMEEPTQEDNNSFVSGSPFESFENPYAGGGGGVGAVKPSNVNVAGGKLDSVGKTDISKESLEYLHDIAELSALTQFEPIEAKTKLMIDETTAKLNDVDKNLLMEASNKKTNVYYLNYQGGISQNNNIQKGQSLEEMKRSLYEETQIEIETGISDLEGVVLA